MKKDNNNIMRMMNKIDNIEDKELKEFIYLLLEERNHLKEKVKIDSLTGAYNRRILKYIKDCNIVVMCDIDNFKSINDNYGHVTGDKVIQNVANVIKNNIRSNDLVCRYGGDEFLIIFFNCNLELIIDRMIKIKEEITNSIQLPDCDVTISIGISKNNSSSINDLIEEADYALYESKKAGKDRVKVYKRKKNNY